MSLLQTKYRKENNDEECYSRFISLEKNKLEEELDSLYKFEEEIVKVKKDVKNELSVCLSNILLLQRMFFHAEEDEEEEEGNEEEKTGNFDENSVKCVDERGDCSSSKIFEEPSENSEQKKYKNKKQNKSWNKLKAKNVGSVFTDMNGEAMPSTNDAKKMYDKKKNFPKYRKKFDTKLNIWSIHEKKSLKSSVEETLKNKVFSFYAAKVEKEFSTKNVAAGKDECKDGGPRIVKKAKKEQNNLGDERRRSSSRSSMFNLKTRIFSEINKFPVELIFYEFEKCVEAKLEGEMHHAEESCVSSDEAASMRQFSYAQNCSTAGAPQSNAMPQCNAMPQSNMPLSATLINENRDIEKRRKIGLFYENFWEEISNKNSERNERHAIDCLLFYIYHIYSAYSGVHTDECTEAIYNFYYYYKSPKKRFYFFYHLLQNENSIPNNIAIRGGETPTQNALISSNAHQTNFFTEMFAAPPQHSDKTASPLKASSRCSEELNDQNYGKKENHKQLHQKDNNTEIAKTTKEYNKILDVAKKYNFSDWLSIAYDFGCEFAPHELFKKYMKYKNQRKIVSKNWSEEEDRKLVKIVKKKKEKRKIISWNNVASFFKNRTSTQCRNRYVISLQDNIKHGDWTCEEDIILQLVVNSFQKRRWNKIQKFLNFRTDVKCRERFENMILNVKKNTWITTENFSLLQTNNYSEFSAALSRKNMKILRTEKDYEKQKKKLNCVLSHICASYASFIKTLKMSCNKQQKTIKIESALKDVFFDLSLIGNNENDAVKNIRQSLFVDIQRHFEKKINESLGIGELNSLLKTFIQFLCYTWNVAAKNTGDATELQSRQEECERLLHFCFNKKSYCVPESIVRLVATGVYEKQVRKERNESKSAFFSFLSAMNNEAKLDTEKESQGDNNIFEDTQGKEKKKHVSADADFEPKKKRKKQE